MEENPDLDLATVDTKEQNSVESKTDGLARNESQDQFIEAIKHRGKVRSNMSVMSTKSRVEKARIDRENIQLAKKLMNVKPSLDIRAMENHFNHHKYISMGMQRIKKKRIPIHEGRVGHLPPIEVSNSESASKAVSAMEERHINGPDTSKAYGSNVVAVKKSLDPTA